MNASDEELHNLQDFHTFTAWVLASGIGVLSSAVVFLSISGVGF